MNKKILPVAVAAICAIGAMHIDAVAKDKSKSQSLGDLSCSENQIAEFDGDLWACIDTPSGGGSDAPEYQFVDGEGTILGDVVYIEDAFTAWGYINGLSTSSTIQVTATYNKSGRSGSNLAGNLKRVRTWYESADCTGPAYVADYEGAPFFLAQNVSGPLPMPPFLAFLETETVYYQADVWNGQASTWNEVTLGSVTGTYDFESYNLTSDINNCITSSLSGISATQIDSFGIPIDAPVEPILIIEK
jgi:hypothetical protein